MVRRALLLPARMVETTLLLRRGVEEAPERRPVRVRGPERHLRRRPDDEPAVGTAEAVFEKGKIRTLTFASST